MIINLIKNIIKALILTLILFLYLSVFIWPKEPFNVFPSLAFVLILISVPVYYFFVIKSDKGLGKIAIPLLSSFIGLFLALYVNGYYNYKKEAESYKLILINAKLEMDYNFTAIKEIEENIDKPDYKLMGELTNSVVNVTLQNPIFLKHTNSLNWILLSGINTAIIVCNNFSEAMLNDKINYDKHKSTYLNNINSLKCKMIQFAQNNKKITDSIFGELTKGDLQKLNNAQIRIDYNYKY